MSGQKMGAIISQVLAEKTRWPDQMNVRKKSQTPQTIRRIRERLGFSQEEFAHWLGLSVRNVMHWETGKSKPTRMTRRLIIDLFREEIKVRPNPLLAWRG